jgi:hypothetical protein
MRRRDKPGRRTASVAGGASTGDSGVAEDCTAETDRVPVAGFALRARGQMICGLADRDRAVMAGRAAAHDTGVIYANLTPGIRDVTLGAKVVGLRMLVDLSLCNCPVMTRRTLLRRTLEAAADVAG